MEETFEAAVALEVSCSDTGELNSQRGAVNVPVRIVQAKIGIQVVAFASPVVSGSAETTASVIVLRVVLMLMRCATVSSEWLGQAERLVKEVVYCEGGEYERSTMKAHARKEHVGPRHGHRGMSGDGGESC